MRLWKGDDMCMSFRSSLELEHIYITNHYDYTFHMIIGSSKGSHVTHKNPEQCLKSVVFQSPSHHSPRPLSRRLFLVSRVISGAAGQLRLAPLSEQDDATTLTAFSCDSAVSSKDGVLLSLCSLSPDAPPLSSSGDSRCSAEAAEAMLS